GSYRASTSSYATSVMVTARTSSSSSASTVSVDHCLNDGTSRNTSSETSAASRGRYSSGWRPRRRPLLPPSEIFWSLPLGSSSFPRPPAGRPQKTSCLDQAAPTTLRNATGSASAHASISRTSTTGTNSRPPGICRQAAAKGSQYCLSVLALLAPPS